MKKIKKSSTNLSSQPLVLNTEKNLSTITTLQDRIRSHLNRSEVWPFKLIICCLVYTQYLKFFSNEASQSLEAWLLSYNPSATSWCHCLHAYWRTYFKGLSSVRISYHRERFLLFLPFNVTSLRLKIYSL